MRELLNTINNNINYKLYRLDLKHHDKFKDTFVNDFIKELRARLWHSDAMYKLSTLPKNTIFTINESEEHYMDCVKLNTHERYNIPRELFPKEIQHELYDRRDCYITLGNDNLYHLYSKTDNSLIH